MDIVGLLFKSKIRQNILVRFFADDGRKFYINEMARLVGTTQGTCRRELNRLVDAGLLLSSRTGNLLYYEANKQSPFYKEFRALIQKTIGIEAILKRKLMGLKGTVYAFIFGSYVSDQLKPGSDIDIVIIGTVNENSLIKLVRDIEGETGREVNYHLYSLREFKSRIRTDSFMKNITANCIIVAGDDGDFKTLLKQT